MSAMLDYLMRYYPPVQLISTEEYCRTFNNPSPFPRSSRNYTPRPSSGNITPIPFNGNYNPSPSLGNITPMPFSGNYNPSPSLGNITPMPFSGNYNPSPSLGNITPLPFSRNYIPSSSHRDLPPTFNANNGTPSTGSFDILSLNRGPVPAIEHSVMGSNGPFIPTYDDQRRITAAKISKMSKTDPDFEWERGRLQALTQLRAEELSQNRGYY